MIFYHDYAFSLKGLNLLKTSIEKNQFILYNKKLPDALLNYSEEYNLIEWVLYKEVNLLIHKKFKKSLYK